MVDLRGYARYQRDPGAHLFSGFKLATSTYVLPQLDLLSL